MWYGKATSSSHTYISIMPDTYERSMILRDQIRMILLVTTLCFLLTLPVVKKTSRSSGVYSARWWWSFEARVQKYIIIISVQKNIIRNKPITNPPTAAIIADDKIGRRIVFRDVFDWYTSLERGESSRNTSSSSLCSCSSSCFWGKKVPLPVGKCPDWKPF